MLAKMASNDHSSSLSFGPFKASRFLNVSDAAYFHILRLSRRLQLHRERTAYIIDGQQLKGRVSHRQIGGLEKHPHVEGYTSRQQCHLQ